MDTFFVKDTEEGDFSTFDKWEDVVRFVKKRVKEYADDDCHHAIYGIMCGQITHQIVPITLRGEKDFILTQI